MKTFCPNVAKKVGQVCTKKFRKCVEKVSEIFQKLCQNFDKKMSKFGDKKMKSALISHGKNEVLICCALQKFFKNVSNFGSSFGQKLTSDLAKSASQIPRNFFTNLGKMLTQKWRKLGQNISKKYTQIHTKPARVLSKLGAKLAPKCTHHRHRPTCPSFAPWFFSCVIIFSPPPSFFFTRPPPCFARPGHIFTQKSTPAKINEKSRKIIPDRPTFFDKKWFFTNFFRMREARRFAVLVKRPRQVSAVCGIDSEHRDLPIGEVSGQSNSSTKNSARS